MRRSPGGPRRDHRRHFPATPRSAPVPSSLRQKRSGPPRKLRTTPRSVPSSRFQRCPRQRSTSTSAQVAAAQLVVRRRVPTGRVPDQVGAALLVRRRVPTSRNEPVQLQYQPGTTNLSYGAGSQPLTPSETKELLVLHRGRAVEPSTSNTFIGKSWPKAMVTNSSFGAVALSRTRRRSNREGLLVRFPAPARRRQQQKQTQLGGGRPTPQRSFSVDGGVPLPRLIVRWLFTLLPFKEEDPKSAPFALVESTR